MKNDQNITITQCKDLVENFCSERDWDQFHNPKELAIGISTEANELLQIFRFKSENEMKIMINNDKRQKIEEELADVFYFVLRFAQMNNMDLYTILFNKISENNKKYPIEKAKGNNKKYNE